ncbi:GNAT family N-acetyltransferase [Parerythrobacter jejuensis]|uniref:GNAT family N-acetyltransferase n=1 Tax=Parerythrobacter jejuensis TaxID=795812 RepID=A0A845AVS4_9SPHN|nr:GNAT family N-acetyltransferase [Parerythrobacter jejuensis]MXP32901.1 GNAT family N-acetyltransferase [Parerythrobacter jejuensis]
MTNTYIRALERGDLDRVRYLVESNDMFPPEMLDEMTSPYFSGQRDIQRWLVFDRSGADGVAYYVPEPLTDGTWNLLLIAVDPVRHGEGIGRKLMEHVEEELASENVRVLLVETSGTPDFARTRGFYEMLQYNREACIRDYYAEGDDKIVFRKALS